MRHTTPNIRPGYTIVLHNDYETNPEEYTVYNVEIRDTDTVVWVHDAQGRNYAFPVDIVKVVTP